MYIEREREGTEVYIRQRSSAGARPGGAGGGLRSAFKASTTYIYIYTEREREREMYVCIYIYIYTHLYTKLVSHLITCVCKQGVFCRGHVLQAFCQHVSMFLIQSARGGSATFHTFDVCADYVCAMYVRVQEIIE